MGLLSRFRRPDRVIVYEDVAGEWRWRRVAANGEVVGDSAEGYSRKHDAKRAAVRTNPGLPVEVRP